MEPEIVETILPILSREVIIDVHRLVGSAPVSFATLRHEIIKQMIEEGLSQNESDEKIARKTGVSKRTVLRHKKKKLFRYKNQEKKMS
jgi:ActR/RegA family two-component response regulator